MRRPLALEVRQERQPLGPRGPALPPPPTSSSNSPPTTSRSQRSDPAAESITPIASHIAGTAWQKTWRRASRLGPVLGQCREDDPRRAEHDRDGPGPGDADPERTRLLVARAADLGRLVRLRQPLERNLERLADLLAPAPAGDVEEERPRGVRRVDRALAGQAQPDVVLRQQDVRGLRPDLGLVAAHPEELRRREAGQRPVSGQLDQPLEPDPLLDLGALRRGPLVVPEDRRAEDPVGRVEQDEPVHLPGEPDRGRVARADRRQRPLARPPPVLRILLGPARLRNRERVLLLGAGENLARPARSRPP